MRKGCRLDWGGEVQKGLGGEEGKRENCDQAGKKVS